MALLGALAPPSSSGRVRCLLGEVSVHLGQRRGGERQGRVFPRLLSLWAETRGLNLCFQFRLLDCAPASLWLGSISKQFRVRISKFLSKGYVTVG